VGTVDGVSALEGDDVDAAGELSADLLGGLAGELALGDVETGDLAAAVVLSSLGGDHGDGRVLDGGGAVALLGLKSLVRGVSGGNIEDRNGNMLILQQDFRSRDDALVIGVEDDGETKDKSVRELKVVDDRLVLGLIHVTSERRETSLHKKLDIAKLALIKIKLKVAGSDSLILRCATL
jgi:hypothetical protein